MTLSRLLGATMVAGAVPDETDAAETGAPAATKITGNTSADPRSSAPVTRAPRAR